MALSASIFASPAAWASQHGGLLIPMLVDLLAVVAAEGDGKPGKLRKANRLLGEDAVEGDSKAIVVSEIWPFSSHSRVH